jgi:hypothetical protein
MRKTPTNEDTKLKAFKAEIKAGEPGRHVSNESEDEMIRRFLVARKWDVDKALDMWRKCNQWRAGFFPLPATTKQQYFTRCGNDKNNNPCLLWWGSKYGDPKAHGGIANTLVRVVEVLEQALSSIDPNSQSKRFTIILFIDQGSVFDAGLIKQVCGVLMNNYPERLSKAVIFPGTKLATSLWSICRTFLDSATREKVVVIPEATPSGFLDIIPKQYLPTMFGGDFVVDGKVQEVYAVKPDVEGANDAAMIAQAAALAVDDALSKSPTSQSRSEAEAKTTSDSSSAVPTNGSSERSALPFIYGNVLLTKPGTPLPLATSSSNVE